MKILTEISTKNRYFTTLPLAILSVAFQTLKPDKLVIFDDGEQQDLRQYPLYQYLFRLLDEKGIKWEVVFGEKKGQHYNHQKAQEMAEDLIWRLDDDEIAEPECLYYLYETIMRNKKIGAVGGLILTPPITNLPSNAENKIDNLFAPNIQWFKWQGKPKEVEHLYSSFLYRKGIANYDLRLSQAAHREETMFSYSIYKAGYKLLVNPQAITYHFRYPEGGIRTITNPEAWEHDEKIFQNWLGIINSNQKLVVLDCGIGDHFAFRLILPELKKKFDKITIACCYPSVFEDDDVNLISIADAQKLVDISSYNIYHKMDLWNWKGHLVDAFRKLYL